MTPMNATPLKVFVATEYFPPPPTPPKDKKKKAYWKEGLRFEKEVIELLPTIAPLHQPVDPTEPRIQWTTGVWFGSIPTVNNKGFHQPDCFYHDPVVGITILEMKLSYFGDSKPARQTLRYGRILTTYFNDNRVRAFIVTKKPRVPVTYASLTKALEQEAHTNYEHLVPKVVFYKKFLLGQ